MIKDFYAEVVKKVTDFAENDLQKYKSMSKEEIEKTRKILLQYAMSLQKISDEKLNRIVELKTRLKNEVVNREELYNISKFFEAKTKKVKKLTEDVYNSLSKGETAPFIKELEKIIETQSKTMKSYINSLFVAAKVCEIKSQKSSKILPKYQSNYLI